MRGVCSWWKIISEKCVKGRGGGVFGCGGDEQWSALDFGKRTRDKVSRIDQLGTLTRKMGYAAVKTEGAIIHQAPPVNGSAFYVIFVPLILSSKFLFSIFSFSFSRFIRKVVRQSRVREAERHDIFFLVQRRRLTNRGCRNPVENSSTEGHFRGAESVESR